MLKKTYDVVYWTVDGEKELVNSFTTKTEAEETYLKCVEGDKEAQVNQSQDIEESYVGSPGH